VKISSIGFEGQERKVSAVISSDAGNFTTEAMWFSWPAEIEAPDACRAATAFTQACLPLALHFSEDLTVEGEVDPLLIENWVKLVRAMKRLHGFEREIELHAAAGTPMQKPNGQVATLFTGGVDSYFTVVSRLEKPKGEKIDALVYLVGYDRDRPLKGEQIKTMLSCASECTDTNLYFVNSNAKSIVCKHVGWSSTAHGSLLIAAACILSRTISKLLVGSTESIDVLERLGTHPLIDPLYTTTAVTVANDGWEFSRNEKIKLISESPFVLRHLRVCWQEEIDDINCGRCEKCVRTMIAMKIFGKLEKCSVFPKSLSLWRVALNGIPTGKHVNGIRGTYDELYKMTQGRPDLRALRTALGVSLRIHPFTYALRKLKRR
jgi:hypothetical protein